MVGNHIERKVSVKKQTTYFLLSYKGMGISDTACVCVMGKEIHIQRESHQWYLTAMGFILHVLSSKAKAVFASPLVLFTSPTGRR